MATQVKQPQIDDNIISGWIPANETWTYSAWDDTNGVSTATITVPTDATTKYQPGMRVWFTQPTDGSKYGIITAVASTTLTVFLNTDYDFDNEAITSPYYSAWKVPFGFDIDPLKWVVETINASNQSQGSPNSGAWYNINTTTIDVPVGAWRIEGQFDMYVDYSTTASAIADAAISTSNNSVSDGGLRSTSFQYSTTDIHGAKYNRSKYLNLSTKDTYYLILSQQGQSPATSIFLIGYSGLVVMRATNAYL